LLPCITRFVMSIPKNEAAVRHQPVAWGSDLRAARLRTPQEFAVRRSSETRLQAAVVPREEAKDEQELYADVACTD
jgi:hypothetical protein